MLQTLQLATQRAQNRPAPIAEARAALDAHDFERARVLAFTATILRPREPAAWLALGLALFRAGRAAEAVPAFRRVTSLDPSSSIAWFNLGSALYQSSEFAAAREAYHRAAALDAKLAPLALYDASLAARDAGRFEEAERDLTDAARDARGPGQTQLRQKIERELSALDLEQERALSKLGKAAVQAGRSLDAIREYRAALEHARRRGATDEELAELAYGLGHALLRDHDPGAAAEAFAEAVKRQPHEADFQLMLGIAEFGAFHDEAARTALTAALALNLAGGSAATARAYLSALGRDRTRDRLTLDVRVGAGYDSNVPQSSALINAGSAALTSADAGFLTADLDLFWRFLGKRGNGLALDYHFGQLAYLSSALDTYSLQEHDLGLSGAWSPLPRLTFELGADGFLVFSGIETFTTFQAGITPVLRILVHEGHDLETQARYTHVWNASLATTYNYLAGHRDEAALGQEWQPRAYHLRLYAGYQLTSERVGVENVPLHQIMFPLVSAFPAGGPLHYNIPYSYESHEVRLSARADPYRDLRLTLDLRYEKLFYSRDSFIRDAQTGAITNRRPREDDRFTVSAVARWYLPKGFDLGLAYTLVVNRSDIDFRNPATALDYDDKNYLKHLVALDAAWRY